MADKKPLGTAETLKRVEKRMANDRRSIHSIARSVSICDAASPGFSLSVTDVPRTVCYFRRTFGLTHSA